MMMSSLWEKTTSVNQTLADNIFDIVHIIMNLLRVPLFL